MTDRTVAVDAPAAIGPYEITGSDDDFGVIGAIERAGGGYEPHVMALLCALVRRGDVCLDVGANIGVLTVALARLCPDGHVYAFEPGDASHGYLTRNVATAQLANVTIERLGLYDVTGTLALHVDASHPGGAHLASTDAHESAQESVAVTRLDDWVKDRDVDRIDVIKIDIEGAELQALDGATDALDRLRPTLVVECNPVALHRFQHADRDALLDRLRALYGRVYFIEGAGLRALDTDAEVRAALAEHGIIDLVCGPRADALVAAGAAAGGGGVAPIRARTVARQMLARSARLRRAVDKVRNRDAAAVPVFVHEPAYEARWSVNRLVTAAGATMTLPIALRNTSESWYSSTFANHPVCASYHWLDEEGRTVERDGIRTFFARPLAPGAETVLDLVVAMPDAPGSYTLVFALVQEAFAWFDDLVPALGIPLPVVIR